MHEQVRSTWKTGTLSYELRNKKKKKVGISASNLVRNENRHYSFEESMRQYNLRIREDPIVLAETLGMSAVMNQQWNMNRIHFGVMALL